MIHALGQFTRFSRKQGMRQHTDIVRIQQGYRFSTVITQNAVNKMRFLLFTTLPFLRKRQHEMVNGSLDLVSFRKSRTRQDDLGDSVLYPIFMNQRMKRMVWVIHRDGGFVPIQNNVLLWVKFQHIIHGNQIRLDVTNHDFHPLPIAVVHLANPTRSFVFDIIHCGEIVKTYVLCRLTTIGESDFLLHRNGRFG